MSDLPDGWSFDRDYHYDGSPAWWHDDCVTPADGQIGGIAVEERLNGHLVAVVCLDCDESIGVTRRPKERVR
jgi:hypothetical protein